MQSVDLYQVPNEASIVHKLGFVKLIKVDGEDHDIVSAARLSYGRGTTPLRDGTGLINYLYAHAHTSPFEMVSMKFQIRMPIFVMRQWVRHRTASLNEYSGRYSEMPELYYVPDAEDIKGQHTSNKQASGEVLTPYGQHTAVSLIQEQSAQAFETYRKLLEMGVSREMARIVLPLNTYTEIVWKMDLHNLLHFLKLRDDSHAQPEIQAYAKVIASKVESFFPITYAAYKEWKNSYRLTESMMQALMNTGEGHTDAWSKLSRSQKETLKEIVDKYCD